YIPEVKTLLERAINEFYCYLYTTNAFPSNEQAEKAITDAWQVAYASHTKNRDAPPYELDQRMIRLASPSLTFDIRPHEETTRDRFAENNVVFEAISATFFDSGDGHSSMGFQYPERFNPLPNESIAFVMTIIRAHIAEWSSGKKVADTFNHGDRGDDSSGHAKHYRGFLANLKEYEAANPQAWKNIRTRMYSRAFRAGGGTDLNISSTRVSSAAMSSATSQLAGRTGLTDSESDHEP
ncbi:uncharacterized protein BXZ73DRAFT_51115, partial [Epithele typhae]|uniref:uncharacterized protein n=1 Tax=Epithele typhae TaxID=378194 RepID=UPI002007C89F